MSWKDGLQSASFRDVAFKVDSTSSNHGRRVVTHEYPSKDEPFTEDLGRKKREFQIEAFVLGDDYFSARNALQSACEKSGPGDLVHPYLGRMSVVCTGCQIKESTQDGRLAKFQLSFVEAGKSEFPLSVPDLKSALSVSVFGVLNAAVLSFGKTFGVIGRAQFVVDSAIANIKGLSGSIKNAVRKVTGSGNPFSDLEFALKNFVKDIATTVVKPKLMGTSMANAQSTMNSVASSARVKLALNQSVAEYGSDFKPIPLTTASRKQQAINQYAVVELVQTLSIAHSVQAASDMLFDTVDEGQQIRDKLADQIDILAMRTRSDDVYKALYQLRADMIKSINSTLNDDTLNVAKLTTITPSDTVPSLVLAYRLYGSISEASDIVSRNAVAHPGFLPAQKDIKVIVRG